MPHPTAHRRALAACLLIAGAASCATPAPVAPPPVRTLSAPALALLDTLYLDEHRAWERYQLVMSRFGLLAPFAELVPAQVERLQVLHEIYTAHAEATEPDPYAAMHYQEYFQDVAGACGVSASFERRTLARYERLLTLALPADVVRAVTANRDGARALDVPRTTACR